MILCLGYGSVGSDIRAKSWDEFTILVDLGGTGDKSSKFETVLDILGQLATMIMNFNSV